MRKAVNAKFTQNHDLAQCLKESGKNIIVEANPSDSFWGAGLSLEDKNIWNMHMWKGGNKLGMILSDLRDKLN